MKASLILILALFIYSCNSKIQQDTKQVANTVITTEQKTKPKVNVNYNSGDVVTSGLQDRDGNLWFGTSRHGVYKYDGTSFTNFTTADGICNKGVFSIIEDKKGLLWFGTTDGLCTYNGKKFTHLPIPNNGKESSKTVLGMLQDKEENIWIGTWGNGAYRYDGKNFKGFLQEAGRLHPDHGEYNNAIRSIIQDQDDNIWFSSLTHGGITRYDGAELTNYMEEDGLCDDMVFSSFVDSKGTIWIGVIEDGDLCSYEDSSFKHYSKADGICFNMVSCFYEDQSGKIWFGSEIENGLCIFDGEGFISFSVKGSEQIPSVRFMLEDKKGHLWIGGRYGSLWRYDGRILEDFTQRKNG